MKYSGVKNCIHCTTFTLLLCQSLEISGASFTGTAAQIGRNHITVEVLRLHRIKRTHGKLSDQYISQSQRSLPTQHTKNTRDEHRSHKQDSNPRTQKPNGFRRIP